MVGESAQDQINSTSHDDAIETVPGNSRRTFLRSAGMVTAVTAAGLAGGALLDSQAAQAASGSPALYFDDFPYAPLGITMSDLVLGVKSALSNGHGFSSFATGGNWVAFRTANSHAFAAFVGSPFANTWAVLTAAGDDALTTLNTMASVIQNIGWL